MENFVFNDFTFRIHKLPSDVSNRIPKKYSKSHSENLLGFFSLSLTNQKIIHDELKDCNNGTHNCNDLFSYKF